MKSITEAREAWKLLNGILCVYKPSGISTARTREMLIINLTRDLNMMELRPSNDYVSIEGSHSSEHSRLRVVSSQSYADSPMVIGPQYQKQDFKINFVNKLGRFTSGLLIVGIGNGCREANRINQNKLIRKFQIDGKLGFATDNYLIDGMIVGKASYKHVSHSKIDLILASVQASHQANTFKLSGIPLDSQEAFEIASSGIVRPKGQTLPIFYKLSCTKFQPPDFTIELYLINEREDYLCQFIHELGLRLKSNAVCAKIRSTTYGLFNLDHALLRKHWDVNNIIQNIYYCQNVANYENTTPKSPLLKAMNK